jgi:hypothetical protein
MGLRPGSVLGRGGLLQHFLLDDNSVRIVATGERKAEAA